MNYTGTEQGQTEGQTLPVGAVFFDFEKERIATLLSRFEKESENAKGITLHFNRPRPENPTELYAVAQGGLTAIMDPDTEVQDDYFKSDGEAVRWSRLSELMRQSSNNTCVFFSRDVLKEYLDDEAVRSIRFYVVGFDGAMPGEIPYMSLVSAGLNEEGHPFDRFTLSLNPCPPKCPGGGPYGSGY